MSTPKKPHDIDPLADAILYSLSQLQPSEEIILGGYFAFHHYLPYRLTHDIDAWWKTRSLPVTEEAIRCITHKIADKERLTLSERRFGETVSFELSRASKKVFSFQIAVRSVELEQPVMSPWPPILIETLLDNLGSKMNALVERGAPRDFTDIRVAVNHKLFTVKECWNTWCRKNPSQALDVAKEKVLHHLETIELRRPIIGIENLSEREQVEEVRFWFRKCFLER